MCYWLVDWGHGSTRNRDPRGLAGDLNVLFSSGLVQRTGVQECMYIPQQLVPMWGPHVKSVNVARQLTPCCRESTSLGRTRDDCGGGSDDHTVYATLVNLMALVYELGVLSELTSLVSRRIISRPRCPRRRLGLRQLEWPVMLVFRMHYHRVLDGCFQSSFA